MSLGIASFKNESSFLVKCINSSSIRIIIGPLIGFGLIKFLKLDGFAAGVLLIQSCMPSAILTYLVGSMYSEKRVVDSIASVIVTSTLLCHLSLFQLLYI